MASFSVVVPALNEEKNLKDTLERLIFALRNHGVDWEIILVNDGSTDNTGVIADKLAEKENRLKVTHHNNPRGIGYCFKEGIGAASKEAVAWFPADGENDPDEIVGNLALLKEADILIPYVANFKSRPLFRRALSLIYTRIINLSFGTNFKYTNGNVIYRRRVFERISFNSKGFFFQAECLIKAARNGFIFVEAPVYILRRNSGFSKALTIRSFYSVISEFLRFRLAL